MLNKAHMMKLAWNILTDPNKLWVKVMKAKYSCGMHTIPKFNFRANSSCTWKAIVQAWDLVKENIIWIVNNGHDVRFWKDSWIPGYKPLIKLFDITVHDAEKDFPVLHYSVNGSWNWNKIQHLIPTEIRDRIAAIHPPNPGRNDFVCWNPTSDGFFSLKTTYELLSPDADSTSPNPLFKKVWKWGGPSRIKAFLWKLTHAKLMTNVERKKRNMTACDLCPRCNNTESIMHMIWDCQDIRDWWSNIISPES